jgi:hypothetical protein
MATERQGHHVLRLIMPLVTAFPPDLRSCSSASIDHANNPWFARRIERDVLSCYSHAHRRTGGQDFT